MRLHRSLTEPLHRRRLAIIARAAAGCLLVVAGSVSTTAPSSGLGSIPDLSPQSRTLTLMATQNTGGAAGEQLAFRQQPTASLLAFAFAPASSTFPASARTGITTDDSVNMRSGPGTDYRILAQLPVDTPSQILDEQDGWYRIVTPWAAEGWVSTDFFTVTQTVSGEQPKSIGSAATVGVVNMRTGPGTGYPISARLSDSTVLEVLAIEDAWYNVRTSRGNIGWVAAEYVPLDWIPDMYGGSNVPTSASNDAVRLAEKHLGARYVWGGSNPSGFDCSGLTWYVYRQLGVWLPGGSTQQFSSRYGRVIRSTSALVPGDLVFFEDTTEEPGITHVGIYAGNNMMIAARSERLGVRYVSLLDPFWGTRFVAGIRPYR
ncbi:MAG: SH3 domain-containing protein [Chloroflexota bacterium]